LLNLVSTQVWYDKSIVKVRTCGVMTLTRNGSHCGEGTLSRHTRTSHKNKVESSNKPASKLESYRSAMAQLEMRMHSIKKWQAHTRDILGALGSFLYMNQSSPPLQYDDKLQQIRTCGCEPSTPTTVTGVQNGRLTLVQARI
jgi:hypothetical protein